MKKTVLFFVLGIALSTQCLFAQVPSYVPTNGLVGYWPFNGNANDESGNGNNGTVNGATLTTDRNGIANKAYSFDGINNIITTNNFTNPIVNWSCSFWFLSNNTSAYQLQNVIGFGQSISTYGGPGVQVNGGLAPNQCTIFNSNPNKILVTDATNECGNLLFADQTANNTWYFVTITKQNTTYSVYVNGTLINTGSLVNIPLTNISFGNRSQLNFQYFNGKIDDVGVFNRALTSQEIIAMYNQVPTYSDTCNNVSGSLTQGLVGYWPFCGNANDDSGHGNNGTVNGNVQMTTDRFGNSNSAYIWQSPNFNSNDYIQLGNLNNQLSNKITLSCWVLLNCAQSENRIISSGEQGLIVYQVQNNNVLLKASFDPAGSIWPSNHLINKDEWHHIVFTADNNLNFSRFYVDGVLTDSSTGTNGSLSNAFWNIGRKSISSFDGFCGKIDDVGIWNRALSASEVSQLFNQNQCFTNTTVTDTLVINVGQLSYTNPVAYANNITLFPNPTSTQVNISFNNITDLTGGNINIINSLGQQVATTPITLSGTSTTMALDTWGGSGLYFVQILNAQGIVVDVKKIILQ